MIIELKKLWRYKKEIIKKKKKKVLNMEKKNYKI